MLLFKRSVSVLNIEFAEKSWPRPIVNPSGFPIFPILSFGQPEAAAVVLIFSFLKELRWKCNNETADSVCNFNRHYAEHSGYFLETSFLQETKEGTDITFYDSGQFFCLF